MLITAISAAADCERNIERTLLQSSTGPVVNLKMFLISYTIDLYSKSSMNQPAQPMPNGAMAFCAVWMLTPKLPVQASSTSLQKKHGTHVADLNVKIKLTSLLQTSYVDFQYDVTNFTSQDN